MKRICIFSFLVVVLLIICSCSKSKTYPSGNPSEVLDAETYNKLQQQYKTIKNFQEGYAIVKKDKYGLIDEIGDEVLKCEYDTIYGLKKYFRIIMKDSLYGVTNKYGEIIKQCSYADVSESRCHYIALKMNDKWGIADSLGKDVTQYKYEKIYHVDDSTFVAVYEKKWGVSDYNGNTIIPYKYDDIHYKWNEKSPVTVVKIGDKYGLYNSRCQQVLECEYGIMFADSSGYMPIKKNQTSNYKTTRYALIEAETGKVIIPFDYMDMGNYSEGVIAVENLNEKWGYIDIKGNTVIPFIYDEAGNFSEGLAAVYKISGYAYHSLWGKVSISKCGYINHKGDVVIPFKFPEGGGSILSSEFHNGLAVQGISKNKPIAEKFGYINKKGEWAILPLYDSAEEFNKGVAIIERNDLYGWINTKGEEIVPCKYDKYGGYLSNDSIIEVKLNNVPYYFNLQGKELKEHE